MGPVAHRRKVRGASCARPARRDYPPAARLPEPRAENGSTGTRPAPWTASTASTSMPSRSTSTTSSWEPTTARVNCVDLSATSRELLPPGCEVVHVVAARSPGRRRRSRAPTGRPPSLSRGRHVLGRALLDGPNVLGCDAGGAGRPGARRAADRRALARLVPSGLRLLLRRGLSARLSECCCKTSWRPRGSPWWPSRPTGCGTRAPDQRFVGYLHELNLFERSRVGGQRLLAAAARRAGVGRSPPRARDPGGGAAAQPRHRAAQGGAGTTRRSGQRAATRRATRRARRGRGRLAEESRQALLPVGGHDGVERVV